MRKPNTARREQIREFLRQGMTQTQVAKTLGIDQSTVSYYARSLQGVAKVAKDDPIAEIRRLAVEYSRPIIMREIVNAAGAQLWR